MNIGGICFVEEADDIGKRHCVGRYLRSVPTFEVTCHSVARAPDITAAAASQPWSPRFDRSFIIQSLLQPARVLLVEQCTDEISSIRPKSLAIWSVGPMHGSRDLSPDCVKERGHADVGYSACLCIKQCAQTWACKENRYGVDGPVAKTEVWATYVDRPPSEIPIAAATSIALATLRPPIRRGASACVPHKYMATHRPTIPERPMSRIGSTAMLLFSDHTI